jgi:hypothetical protein
MSAAGLRRLGKGHRTLQVDSIFTIKAIGDGDWHSSMESANIGNIAGPEIPKSNFFGPGSPVSPSKIAAGNKP